MAGQRRRGTPAALESRQRRADRPSVAHRVGSGRRMDACGRRRRRYPAATAAGRHIPMPAQWSSRQIKPPPGPMPICSTIPVRSRPCSLRRPWFFAAHRAVLRGHRPLAGRGAHGVGRCRRTSPGGRRVCHKRLHSAVLRPGDRPIRPLPAARGNASVFLPSVPTLLLLASELEAQRNHVLGQPDGRPTSWPRRQRRKDEPSELENSFESLGADAELDQVIFDGSSFGTATPAGSEEEADYLGIPGLLDPGQMRDLLRRHQEQQFDRRATTPEPVTRHGQLRDLRRELNALVTAAHHRIGKPHGWIHNELRRLCGGPPVAAATSEQLAARIEAVRRLSA